MKKQCKYVSTYSLIIILLSSCTSIGNTSVDSISDVLTESLSSISNTTSIGEEISVYEDDEIKYLDYGSYPQTVVLEEELISDLNSIEETNANGYYSYNGNEYAKLVANPSDYFEPYEIYKFSDNQTDIEKEKVYYFKVEPIKWRVLKEAEGTYQVLTEGILDSHKYDDSCCNYKESDIREWLNDDFYNNAFWDKSHIKNTLVDNSVESTGYVLNPNSCADTNDNVYLLSREEVTDWNYGFNTVEDRLGIVSDYARANGCYIDVESGHYGEGPWWFRSPYYDGSTLAQCVYKQGELEVGNVDDYRFGVRPVLTVAI